MLAFKMSGLIRANSLPMASSVLLQKSLNLEFIFGLV
jgi:hypothetical protein